MIDHISLRVRDLEASKKFYAAALAPLGYELLRDYPVAVGFGAGGKPDLWLTQGAPATPASHVAIRAKSRAVVDAFHAAALAAGGKDDGAPGVRELYHPSYYGAFILDPDGHNLEAVCHDPATAGP